MLPSTPRKEALTKNPKMLLLFGPPKVGKTELFTKPIHGEHVLVIDTEKGTNTKENIIAVHATTVPDLISIYKELKKEADAGNMRKYVALDTIDNLVKWVGDAVLSKYNIESLADLPSGKGWTTRTSKVLEILALFDSVCEHFIVVGHEKRNTIGEDKLEVDVSSINLGGALKIDVSAKACGICKALRNEEGELVLSFIGKEGQLEAGSRCKHLKGQVIPGDLERVFIK